jgi:3-keto-disaccharide hydrolase
MKKHFYLLVSACFLLSQASLNLNGQTTLESYFGRWSLYLPGGAGWLEVHQEAGYPDASLLWYGGSVLPVDDVYMDGEKLVVTQVNKVVRKKDVLGNPVRTHTITTLYTFELKGVTDLNGVAIAPKEDGSGVDRTKFTGKMIPDMPAPPDMTKITYGNPIELFNGKDLSGWEIMEEGRKNGFQAVNGVLVNNPIQKEGEAHINYGNLRTKKEFEDFNLKLEVNVPAGSNSGIYLRGLYEIQVFDSYGQPLDSHNMGAVYSRIAPSKAAEKPAGEWQTFDITLYKRYVTVILNGVKIIDNQPLLGVTGGAISADEFKPGPIYLQGDHGTIMYRNIVLTPIIE